MKVLQALYVRLWCATPSTWLAALLARLRRAHGKRSE